MFQFGDWVYATWEYIKKDYHEWPLRFCAEVFSWACSVVSAIIFAASVPEIPVVPLYSIFISGCAAAAWTCWTRGSFGLLANYAFLIFIDAIGLIRYIIKTSV
jgi:hypothetical protein